MRSELEIPIYGGWVVLRVGASIPAARKLENKFLGVCGMSDDELEDAYGLMCWLGSHYGIFFNRHLDHGAIAHEIFHLAHRVLEHCGVNFTEKNHEPFTYLIQFLTMWVYRELKKAKIKIN